jgi:ubiquinone/menaquinone biosynthesis C-methylase UbiE
MEGAVARWYARNTGNRDRQKAAAEVVSSQLAPGSSVLEVAPGPGYLAIELARAGYRVVGLDISRTFIEIANANAQAAVAAVDFRHGNVSHMPFAADSFDFIICQAAFKNFSEPVLALCEMHRVLKPGGKAVILDLRPDASPAQIDAEVKKMRAGSFSSLFIALTLRWLRKRAQSREQFKRMASQSPFSTCEIEEDPVGFMVSMKK